MMNDNGSTNGGMKPHTTVTVTTDPGPAPQSLEIRLNIGYFKTLPGMVKLVQLVLGIICMACSAPATGLFPGKNYGLGHNHFFLFVIVTTFIISLVWVFFYLLQMRDYVKVKMPITFMKLEVIFTVVATLFYIVAFITLLAGFGWCTTGHSPGSNLCDARVAGGVFAIFNTIAYGLGSYLVYQELCSTPPELQ